MPEAARATDQISHTSAVTGLLVGLAVGAVAAVAIAATVATGGVAGVLIAAGIGLAGTAGGGLAGEYIGAVIPSAPTGVIVAGSPNVFTGGLPAARTVLDSSVCSGMPLMPHGPSPIAQGSTTVFINGMMAARVGDLLVCSAKISSGCLTVIIGGASGTAPGMQIEPEIPVAVNDFLFGAMVAGIVLGTGGTALESGVPVALAGLAGSLLGGAGLSWVGGKVGGGIGDLFGAHELGKRIGEVAGGVVGSFLGGGIAEKWASEGPTPLDPETPPSEDPETPPLEDPETPPSKPPSEKPSVPPRTQDELDDLARDPARGGKIDPKSEQERAVALGLESRGDVPGPVTRDPTGAADFIDGNGQPWDVKGFNSNFPPNKGGFDPMVDAGKVDTSLTQGENVMIDTSKMSPSDVAALRQQGASRGWGDKVKWWP